MKHQFSHSKIASKAAALVALGFFAATSAQADIVPSGGATSPIDLKYTGSVFGFETFTIATEANRQVSAGSLKFDTAGPAGSFASYCVELGQFTSDVFKTYTLASFSPAVGNGLAHLYQVAGGSPGNKPDSAAFQAAVWEIVFETSGSYALGSGTFQGSFASNPITTQANTWLTAVNNFQGTTLYSAQQYVNRGQQDYLVITSVPEPESYALLLAGLGLIGTIARRRSQQKVA
jgi:hypothetical protein